MLTLAALVALMAAPLRSPEIHTTSGSALTAPAKILLISGPPSHGPGEHEYHAGCLLLADCLGKQKGIEPVVIAGGWPDDVSVFKGVRTIVLFMDGGGGHPLLRSPERLATMKELMHRGVGLVCIHYTVEAPKGELSDDFLEWLGGYYETGYSTNPMNTPHLTPTGGHPVTRGIPPFTLLDEWYYRIRFRDNDARVTPVLTAELPQDHPNRETLAWATIRKDGGRAFGFTGGHFHKNWGVPEFRKLVLNGILWTAKLNVPPTGVESTVTPEQLAQNLDRKASR